MAGFGDKKRELSDGSKKALSVYGEAPIQTRSAVREIYGQFAAANSISAKDIAEFIKKKENAGRKLRGILPVLTGGIDAKTLPVLHGKASVKNFRKNTEAVLAGDYASFKKNGGKWAVLSPAGRFDLPSQMALACLGLPWEIKRRLIVSINQPLSKIVSELGEYAPAALVGYPSVLLHLANEAAEGRLKITPVAIVCWGEVLRAQEEAAIVAAFNCKVIDVYMSAEGAMAKKCGHGSFHALNGCTIDIGEAGEILLNNGVNTAFPLMRYDTGDVGESVGVCPCGQSGGFRLLGRRSDYLTFGERIVPPDALIGAMDALAEKGVERYQIKQADENTLAIHLLCPADERFALFRQCMGAVESALAGLGIDGVRIALGGDAPAAHKRSGRFRRITGGLV